MRIVQSVSLFLTLASLGLAVTAESVRLSLSYLTFNSF